MDNGADCIFWIWTALSAWIAIRYGMFVRRCRLRLLNNSVKSADHVSHLAEPTPDSTDTEKAKSQHPLHVVIPCRNEARTLPFLLSDLQAQTVPVHVWVVDDGSDDLTKEVAEKWGVHVIQNRGQGKKMALVTAHAAIHSSEPSSWMATLDADVSVPSRWAATMLEEANRTGADAVVGGVGMGSSSSDSFRRFQSQEYACMMSWIKGGVLSESLAMGSGANLMFKTALYPEDQLHSEQASGDDAFALMAMKNQGHRIAWSQPSASLVLTKPAETWSELWNQRARWASKTSSQDLETQRVARLIASVQIMYVSAWLMAALMMLIGEFAWAIGGLLTVHGIIAGADAHLVRTAQAHFPLQVHPTDLWIFPLRYSRLVWGSWWYLLRRKVEWKGRRL